MDFFSDSSFSPESTYCLKSVQIRCYFWSIFSHIPIIISCLDSFHAVTCGTAEKPEAEYFCYLATENKFSSLLESIENKIIKILYQTTPWFRWNYLRVDFQLFPLSETFLLQYNTCLAIRRVIRSIPRDKLHQELGPESFQQHRW